MIFYGNPYRTMLLFVIYNYTSTLIKIIIFFTKDIFISVIYYQIVYNTHRFPLTIANNICHG